MVRKSILWIGLVVIFNLTSSQLLAEHAAQGGDQHSQPGAGHTGGRGVGPQMTDQEKTPIKLADKWTDPAIEAMIEPNFRGWMDKKGDETGKANFAVTFYKILDNEDVEALGGTGANKGSLGKYIEDRKKELGDKELNTIEDTPLEAAKALYWAARYINGGKDRQEVEKDEKAKAFLDKFKGLLDKDQEENKKIIAEADKAAKSGDPKKMKEFVDKYNFNLASLPGWSAKALGSKNQALRDIAANILYAHTVMQNGQRGLLLTNPSGQQKFVPVAGDLSSFKNQVASALTPYSSGWSFAPSPSQTHPSASTDSGASGLGGHGS